MKPGKPQKLWMMRGPGGLAPYFGCAFTKKELMERPEVRGWGYNPTDIKPVRVTVQPGAAT